MKTVASGIFDKDNFYGNTVVLEGGFPRSLQQGNMQRHIRNPCRYLGFRILRTSHRGCHFKIGCSQKISQYSQEDTCVGVSF